MIHTVIRDYYFDAHFHYVATTNTWIYYMMNDTFYISWNLLQKNETSNGMQAFSWYMGGRGRMGVYAFQIEKIRTFFSVFFQLCHAMMTRQNFCVGMKYKKINRLLRASDKCFQRQIEDKKTRFVFVISLES